MSSKKKINDNPFKSISSIETSFQLMKGVFIAYLVLLSILIVGVLALGLWSYQKASKRIYVMNDNGLMVSADAVNSYDPEARSVEVKNHIWLVYGSFFTYDQNNVEEQTRRGLALMGNSGKELYETFKEKGWYTRIIQNNINVESEIKLDSILVDVSSYPYKATARGYQKLSRETYFELRKLDFSCSLYNVSRSELNPHGLLIEQFTLIDNKEIKP